MSYQVEETQLGNNNYIPMEKMFLHADDIEENRRSAETYLNKALGMGVITSSFMFALLLKGKLTILFLV